jgi:hypothetical protein
MIMILHITELRHLGQFRLQVAFDNGEAGEVDLRDALDGPVFAALRDVSAFSRVRLDSLFKTVVWECGADMAPEYLLDLLHAQTRKVA